MYGWTDEYVLSMPFFRFCSMLKNGRRWHARRMIEHCDVQSISIGNAERFERIRDAWSQGFEFEKAKMAQVDASKTKDVAFLKDMFAAVKGS